MKAWAGAVPFLFGAIAARLAFYLRRSLPKTASAETMNDEETALSQASRITRAAPDRRSRSRWAAPSILYVTTYMQKYLMNEVKWISK